MAELKAERDKCAKEENKIKSAKIEIDQELDKYEEVIKENKSKASHAKKQVGVLSCGSLLHRGTVRCEGSAFLLCCEAGGACSWTFPTSCDT